VEEIESVRLQRRRGKWTEHLDARIVDMNAVGVSAAEIASDPYVKQTEVEVLRRLDKLGVRRRKPGVIVAEIGEPALARLRDGASVRGMDMARFASALLDAASQMIDAVLDDEIASA
jgi:hypothetical protein